MKEYKYKINGNNYNVSVGDIVDNIAEVMVNGMPYKVELENKQTSVNVVSAPRPSAVPRTSTGEKTAGRRSIETGYSTTARHNIVNKRKSWRHSKSSRHGNYIGSHENGKLHTCRIRRKNSINQRKRRRLRIGRHRIVYN